MAPTRKGFKATLKKASTILEGLKDRLEQLSAHTEAVRQNLHDSQMRLTFHHEELVNQLQHARAAALQGYEQQLQKAIEDSRAHLSASAAEKLLASIKNSDDLAAGEGEVDEEVSDDIAEMAKVAMSQLLASNEAIQSVLQQVQNITLLQNMSYYSIFFDGAGNIAHGANYTEISPFGFLDANTAHGVNDTKLFSTADGNATPVMVAGCRFRAVASCRRQADCSFGETNGTLARELAKCDVLTSINVSKTGFLAGTLAVLFVIAVMLCSAFRLLSERQVRVFGLGVIAVYLVVRFGGM